MAAQKETKLVTVNNEEAFKIVFSKSSYSVLFFWADWHDPCKQIASVINELSNDYQQLQFYSINAEQYESLTTKFNVEAVPTVILCKQQKETKRLEAETVPNTVDAIKQFAQQSITAASVSSSTSKSNDSDKKEESIEELNARIAKLISAAPIMLFMKGKNFSITFSRNFPIFLRFSLHFAWTIKCFIYRKCVEVFSYFYDLMHAN